MVFNEILKAFYHPNEIKHNLKFNFKKDTFIILVYVCVHTYTRVFCLSIRILLFVAQNVEWEYSMLRILLPTSNSML